MLVEVCLEFVKSLDSDGRPQGMIAGSSPLRVVLVMLKSLHETPPTRFESGPTQRSQIHRLKSDIDESPHTSHRCQQAPDAALRASSDERRRWSFPVSFPGSHRVVQLFRWIRRSAALVIASVSAIILGYAVGVFVADINDSNSTAPPPARNSLIDKVVSPSGSSFPLLAILIPVTFVVLLVLLRNRRPVKWLLHRAKDAAETYALPLPPEIAATVTVNPFARSTTSEVSSSVRAAQVALALEADVAPQVDTVPEVAALSGVSSGPNADIAARTPNATPENDGCIICVLTFRDDPLLDQPLKRTMTVARGIEASKRAIEQGFLNEPATAGDGADHDGVDHDGVDRESPARRPAVDVISLFGVDQASVVRAFAASVELGRLIEREHGFRLLVANGLSARAQPATAQDGGSDESFSSVFFNTTATHVDMRGLVPLAVYARVDLPVAEPDAQPIEPVSAQAPPSVAESAPSAPAPFVYVPVVPVPVVAATVLVEPVGLETVVEEPVATVPVVEPAVVVPVVADPGVAVLALPVATLTLADESDERKICTMFEMLNELLAIGDSAPEPDRERFASSR